MANPKTAAVQAVSCLALSCRLSCNQFVLTQNLAVDLVMEWHYRGTRPGMISWQRSWKWLLFGEVNPLAKLSITLPKREKDIHAISTQNAKMCGYNIEMISKLDANAIKRAGLSHGSHLGMTLPFNISD